MVYRVIFDNYSLDEPLLVGGPSIGIEDVVRIAWLFKFANSPKPSYTGDEASGWTMFVTVAKKEYGIDIERVA